MGWDVSYHPLAPSEVQTIYFRGLADPQFYLTLGERFHLEPTFVEHLRIRFDEARNLDRTIAFNKGHVFYMAIVAGYLRRFWYLRGAAFSALADDLRFQPYISDWKNLVPHALRKLNFQNRLTENYCGGVFLSTTALRQLRADAQHDPEVRGKLESTFSHGRLAVFWQAVDFAIANKLGLLEASEVIEPNPFDLNSSTSLSNLLNCDPAGALLYASAAREQLTDVMVKNKPAPRRVVAPKKGLIAKIFRQGRTT